MYVFQPSHRKLGHRASSAIDNKEGRNLGGREKSNNAIEVSRPSTTQAFRVGVLSVPCCCAWLCPLSLCLIVSLVPVIVSLVHVLDCVSCHCVRLCPLSLWLCPWSLCLIVSLVALFDCVPGPCVRLCPLSCVWLCPLSLFDCVPCHCVRLCPFVRLCPLSLCLIVSLVPVFDCVPCRCVWLCPWSLC